MFDYLFVTPIVHMLNTLYKYSVVCLTSQHVYSKFLLLETDDDDHYMYSYWLVYNGFLQ